MQRHFAITMFAVAGILTTGCATKKYVRNTAAPIQAKVDQVGDQANKNTQGLDQARTQIKQVDDRAQSGINGANERASTADQHAQTADQHAASADQHAGNAMNKANQAAQSADQVRQAVMNLDDYKLQNTVSVPFKFNQYTLSNAAKQDLDKLADGLKNDKRYYVAVEGFTDKTGPAQYNEVLSQHRADAVVEYLVGKYDIPIYRIQMVGLGEQKPVDEGRGRAANAKNRRVEVRVFTADEAVASLNAQH